MEMGHEKEHQENHLGKILYNMCDIKVQREIGRCEVVQMGTNMGNEGRGGLT